MNRLPILAVALLAACTPPETEPEVLDLRQDFPAPAENALVWDTPEWIIPAYSEKQFCVVDTYDGEDVGIVAQANYQAQNGHHIVIFGTTATERNLPDGFEWDCTETEDLGMADLDPIIIGGDVEENADGSVTNRFELPEGMGAPLDSGTRIVIQSHYINPTDTDFLIRDQAQLEVVPEDEITTWAAPLVNTVTDELLIPMGSTDYNLTFDCGFDDEYSLLFMGGHMHEWGTQFQTRFTPADGETEVVYEVPEWDPYMRDAPPFTNFEAGEFTVAPGDTMTTSCTWFNDEDHDLEFPQEMCVTFGMVYPAKVPVICEPDF